MYDCRIYGADRYAVSFIIDERFALRYGTVYMPQLYLLYVYRPL